MDERPAWARRIRAEREARSWSQSQWAAVLRMHSDRELVEDANLLRNIKRWESGTRPDEFHRPLIAKSFGTVTAALFGRDDDGLDVVLAGAGMDTTDILARLRGSAMDAATLDGLRLTVDHLCCEYPHQPAGTLLVEGRQWLRRITELMDRRLTLAQHRDLLALAGQLALLVGCVEYDSGERSAEQTRQAAFALGGESGDAGVQAWALEMRAWFSITRRDYRAVIAACEQGELIAPGHSAAVQLAAQRAKAWARLGDRRQVEVALDKGRTLLEGLPYPDNTDHHFVVDPDKWDFYAMDCYRVLGETRLAETYADQVLTTSTGADGVLRSPMRAAEARITLGVLAAREGDVDQALAHGQQALQGDRKSIPSLLMVSTELAHVLGQDHAAEPAVADYLDQLRQLRAA